MEYSGKIKTNLVLAGMIISRFGRMGKEGWVNFKESHRLCFQL